MAVYTSVTKSELENFLEQYNLGKLISYEGIIEGIENTNYKIIMEEGGFILTIFEKRVDPQDLPFFMNLQKHLSGHGFHCPIPVENKDKNIVNSLCNKKAIIISFLEGKKIDNPQSHHCLQVGKMVSNFHQITKTFENTRKNTLDIDKWKFIFSKCLEETNHDFKDLIEPMKNELLYLHQCWPKNLPQGTIHGDLFKDNIFFQNEKLSGLIDFYFSCNDFYAYELAITTNAWCFDIKKGFNLNNFESLLNGYQINSNISSDEKKNFNTLLRGAAMRILVTRLHDQLFHPDGAMVIPKDPLEYFTILKWHQENTVFNA
tara:strand:- start:286 stop:1236 length:951 start_codon:yes stop_codon:yes gene_type:complete